MRKALLSRVAVVALLFCLFSSASLSQDAPSERKEDSSSDSAAVHHYVRAKDPKWYASLLGALRQQLEQIDGQIRIMGEARKDGSGTTGAIDLDKAPEGVTADAQLLLLKQRRTEILQRIGAVKDEARRNDVASSAIRAEEAAWEAGTETRPSENEEEASNNPEIVETENALRQEKEHLERARSEADLLERKLDLDKRTVYSNPEHTLQQTGKAKLTAMQNQISEKQEEIQQTEQKIANLEEHLQDLKLNLANKKSASANDRDAANRLKLEERDEAYWRKRFVEIHYKIRMAQSELDVLQRELDVSLLLYNPNPQKTLRENVTRRDINAHRQAIEDKKEELADLRRQLSDLEDELRHAGGDPEWSRE